MAESKAEPEAKRFDNRIIPTFLQKTYNLVDVENSSPEPGV
jgi:hypothetical protein